VALPKHQLTMMGWLYVFRTAGMIIHTLNGGLRETTALPVQTCTRQCLFERGGVGTANTGFVG